MMHDSPVHAAHYADQALAQRATVIENVRLARDTYRVRLDCSELGRRIVPGQFLMLKLAGLSDPLLGRPFALYDTVLDATGNVIAVDVVYLVLGKMTAKLAAHRPGEPIDFWGPLGNGFTIPETDHLIMVAGGIGQTPFLALGKEALGVRQYGDRARRSAPVPRVTLFYGVRNKEYLAGVEDFRATGMEVRLSSDDGSVGQHGFVTDLLRGVLSESESTKHVVCCRPEKMMEAVAHLSAEAGTPCQVSLETPMACGIGICFSCVTKVAQADGGWDYKRTCVEGPVFDAKDIVW